jgi:hypothetical protein
LIEFKDVCSWSYEKLKVFEMEQVVHAIPILPNSNPHMHKQRKNNPILEQVIRDELDKMEVMVVIYLIQYS